MSNPTTPFGWQMPENTDLVTDLPADFEVFGQAVATSMQDLLGGTTGQVLAKASNADMDFVWSADAAGMTNPMTTTGDVIYSSPGSTPVRLGIGTSGQILQVNSGATAPEWATPGGAGANFTLLNAGGTALTGASTITVSGISSKDKIVVLVASASSANASAEFTLRFNADSGSNYSSFGSFLNGGDTGTDGGRLANSFSNTGTTSIPFGKTFNQQSGTVSGGLSLTGGAASGVKPFIFTGAGAASGGQTGQTTHSGQGIYSSASTISSVSIISSTGNFDAGTIFVYTSA